MICKECGGDKIGKSHYKELCEKCYHKQNYQENKEKINLNVKKWREQNIEKAREYDRKWRENNREKDNLNRRKNYYKNREKILKQERIRWKIWYEKNKKIINIKAKLYRDNNKKKVQEWSRNDYQKNKDKYKEAAKKWYNKNKKRYIKAARIRYNYRMKTDINYKIRMNYSCICKNAIKENNGTKAYKTIKLIGCSIQNVRNIIEKQWKENMNWNNYGQWHIDHIIPLSAFKLVKPEEQLMAFHYTNLQPLWSEDNLKKGAIFDEKELEEYKKSFDKKGTYIGEFK